MRIAICSMSLLATTLFVGCGQTGNLQLPSDPNYDKRAQYLLYKDGEKSANVKQSVASEGGDKVQVEKSDLENANSEKSGLEDTDQQAEAADIVETNQIETN